YDERVPELTQRDHWPDRTRFYWVLLGSTGFRGVRFGSTGFAQVLGSTTFRKVRSHRLHQVAPWAERLGRPAIADGGRSEHAGDGHWARFKRPGRKRRELQLRRTPLTEGLTQRATKHFMDERLLQEPHFRFGRVHVHIDAVGCHLDEQMYLGT